MKCIRCDHDSKYKDRSDRKCPNCHKEFAFEPQKGDPLPDAAFKSALDAVSAKGRLRWGVEHLYYEVCRRRRRAVAGALRAIVVFVAFVVGTVSGVWWGGGLVGVVLGVAAAVAAGWLLRPRPSTTVRVSAADFDKMWERWQKVHGAPKEVITRKRSAPTGRKVEPDLADYSFDRAVICDRARTVDLLVANNFHFENNCAVLSVGGYPPGPFETIRTMLRRNPRLRVYALHDATAPGCRLAHQLAASEGWFKHLPTVTDVGLRPAHAGPFTGLLLPNSGGAVVAGEGIDASEAAWLSRYALELAAIRPEQVLKRLFRAINRASDDADRDRDGEDGVTTTGGNGSAHVAQDSEAFAADAGDADGGADAFG